MTGGHLCAVSNVLMSLGKRWYCGQAVTQERCWLMRDGPYDIDVEEEIKEIKPETNFLSFGLSLSGTAVENNYRKLSFKEQLVSFLRWSRNRTRLSATWGTTNEVVTCVNF